MSTSLLYHGFGPVGYRYVRQHFHEGKVIFRIEKPRELQRDTANSSGSAVRSASYSSGGDPVLLGKRGAIPHLKHLAVRAG